MPRATTVLVGTTLAGFVATIWLYVENRSLRSDLDAARADKEPKAEVAARPADPIAGPSHSTPLRAVWAPPVLPQVNQESRMDRRARRQQEVSAMLGRGDGETDDEYRARMLPLLK